MKLSGSQGGVIQHATFTPRALRAEIRSTDGWDYGIDFSQPIDSYIEEAALLFDEPNALDSFNRFQLGSKNAVSYTDYPTVLLLRTLSTYLKARFGIGSHTRETITKGLIQALGDGSRMHIIRRDIRSFYENVPTSDLYENLVFTTALPPKARRIIERFFELHCSDGVGIPRGLGLSATLAELAMQSFDTDVRRIKGVYRYHRFVDDIIVICTNSAGVADKLEGILPSPMALHDKKRCDIDVSPEAYPDEKFQPSFDYLGYKFSLSTKVKRGGPRLVSVGVADSKINRMKSKVILASKAYVLDRNHTLFLGRLRFLTGNYKFEKKRPLVSTGSTIVKSGIFYNYKLCGVYEGQKFSASSMPELRQLDWFLQNSILGHRYPLGRLLNQTIPQGVLDQLRKLSFSQGHLRAFRILVTNEDVKSFKVIWKNV